MAEVEKGLQEAVAEFERNRIQMLNVSAQKQQLQAQGRMLSDSLEALDSTKEKKVYKAVGNILILSDAKDIRKELADQKESFELRVKTLQKQEDSFIDKLNKLKSQIEAAQKPADKGAKQKGS